MANPQKENGHIRIANTIWESLCQIRIPGEIRQILDTIIRQTWGYNKKSDMITLDKFAIMTGLKKSNVIRAIKKLYQMNLIIRYDNGRYAFQKDFDKWKPLSKKITIINTDNSIIRTDNKLLSKKIIPIIQHKDIKTNTTIKRQVFVPPTLEEVADYIKNKGFHVNPEKFFYHYEANGWVQGHSGKPVKNWRACCHTWIWNNSKFGNDSMPQRRETSQATKNALAKFGIKKD